MTILQCADKTLDLSTPQVMGILNVTPDSFSDGGNFFAPDNALKQAEAMVAQGASIIDIGGESTRPGAQAVSVQEELDRVIPLVERLSSEIPAIISVDTNKAQVMTESASAGAGMLNDVMALQNEGALTAAAATGLPVCLMHMQGEPRTMQKNPHYQDVVAEVTEFLLARVNACETAGIARDKLILDPGFGFGKSLSHNLTLFKHLDRFVALDLPLLVGASRKSMLGLLTGREVGERLSGSIALATTGVLAGAHIIRAHDVAETVDAVKVAHAIRQADES